MMCPWTKRTEVGIYKRKQESKKTGKHAFDQESDQEKKRKKTRSRLRKKRKKKFRIVFLVAFLDESVFSFFLFFLSSFLLKISASDPLRDGREGYRDFLPYLIIALNPSYLILAPNPKVTP